MEDEKNYIFFFLFFFLEKKTQGFCIIYDVFGSKDVRPVNPLSAFHDVFLLSSLRRTLTSLQFRVLYTYVRMHLYILGA